MRWYCMKLYEKSKTAPTETEREKFRKEYLDRKGIPDSFAGNGFFDDMRQERVTLP